MDQEIQVYFMVNPHLLGSGQGLHYGEKNLLFFHVYGKLFSWLKF